MKFDFAESYYVDVTASGDDDNIAVDVRIRTPNEFGCYYPAIPLNEIGTRLVHIIMDDINTVRHDKKEDNNG